MVAEVKLAVAGSGKTRWLGKSVSPSKRNLLITYTNQNVNNITKSIQLHLGIIPENTTVITYTRFVYYWLIRPYEPSIVIGDNTGQFRSDGIDISTPPVNDRTNPGNGYHRKDNVFHYLDKYSNKLYSNRLSELYCSQKAPYKKNARNAISQFFDELYVDEFQDFTDNDYKLLMDLTKTTEINIHYVGDFYQSLVSRSNKRGGTPYSKVGSLAEMVKKLENQKVPVDTKTLRKSWRCSAATCNFVNQKLGIPIECADSHEGEVLQLSEDRDISDVLYNPEITKLMWNAGTRGFNLFPSTNKWGYSKGDTYTDVCVILISSTDCILSDQKIVLKPLVLHTLYVALTRARRNVYLIDSAAYKRFVNALINT